MFISQVKERGPAAETGRVTEGMRFVRINGEDVMRATKAEAGAIIRNSRRVELVLEPPPRLEEILTSPMTSPGSSSSPDIPNPFAPRTADPVPLVLDSPARPTHQQHQQHQHQQQQPRDDREDAPNLFAMRSQALQLSSAPTPAAMQSGYVDEIDKVYVNLRKNPQLGYGLTLIEGEAGTGVFVQAVKDGPAADSGVVAVGMQVSLIPFPLPPVSPSYQDVVLCCVFRASSPPAIHLRCVVLDSIRLTLTDPRD